jgi:hypothetical protein
MTVLDHWYKNYLEHHFEVVSQSSQAHACTLARWVSCSMCFAALSAPQL